MRSIANTPPPLPPGGAPTWAQIEQYLARFQRDLLARFDPRFQQNDFSSGLVATAAGGVTLGTAAGLAGRASSSLPTVLSKVTDEGKAQDQRFLPQVQTGGVSSRQDAGPVSAEASGGSATITIDAHTVQYGFGTVAYNSATISGLTPDANYYVYTDDPNYVGGAVSYTATTNGQLVTAQNGRYFVGAVRTTTALSVANINGATSANPIVISTTSPHGWNTGNTVLFAALPGSFGTALNSTVRTITRTGASSFSVAVDGTGFPAYTSGGTATRQSMTATSGAGGASGWIDMAFLGQY